MPTAEGYYDFTKSRYVYNYTDHLGNVRISFYKNGSTATILEENNYYPFGLKHEGYNPYAGNPAYQYKYNGKELQESGMYDYGARFYMPEIGRWGVVDPLAETMPEWSPYNYALNNPLLYTDPDGSAPEDSIETGCCNSPTNDTEVGQQFAEMIAGGINSIRASVSNLFGRVYNLFAKNEIRNKYVVEDGSLVLVTGVPKETNREKIVNSLGDVATIGLAALGGPEGALTAQGGKAGFLKTMQDAKQLKNLRQSAVRKAWKQEKAIVESGAEGTRNWTKVELKELKANGKVKGYQGHHINNVKHHPEHAGNPDNIEFVNKKEHLQRHNGNYRNKTTGEMKNRNINQ